MAIVEDRLRLRLLANDEHEDGNDASRTRVIRSCDQSDVEHTLVAHSATARFIF